MNAQEAVFLHRFTLQSINDPRVGFRNWIDFFSEKRLGSIKSLKQAYIDSPVFGKIIINNTYATCHTRPISEQINIIRDKLGAYINPAPIPQAAGKRSGRTRRRRCRARQTRRRF